MKFQVDTNVYGCAPCPGQCSLCSVSNVSLNSLPQCMQCASNYTLKKSNCVKCTTKNCMICSPLDQSNCLQCIDGYTYNNSGDCIACNITNCILPAVFTAIPHTISLKTHKTKHKHSTIAHHVDRTVSAVSIRHIVRSVNRTSILY